MNLIRIVLVLAIEIVNTLDKILCFFGWKICKLTREDVLKGLPVGAAEELEKPDIKPFVDVLFKDDEIYNKLNLVYRLWMSILIKQDIRNRLRISETIRSNPGIRKVQVKKPVFIIGPARTGTTFLHWLLKSDTQFRCPAIWELFNPCPPGRVEDYRKDPRYVETKRVLDGLKLLSPEQYAAHPTEPESPEECLILLQKSFIHVLLFGASERFTKAVTDCQKSVARHLYDYFKLQVQLLSWGHDMSSVYLGKSSFHLMYLDTLIETFPDARFIFTVRPVNEFVASKLSLYKYFQDPMGFDTSSEHWLKRSLGIMKRECNDGLAAIERAKKNNPKVKVYFLPYEKLVSDTMGEVRKLYDFLGMDLTPEAESAMITYLENDPKKKKYGKHKYKEGVHLPKEVLEMEFKGYIDVMSKIID